MTSNQLVFQYHQPHGLHQFHLSQQYDIYLVTSQLSKEISKINNFSTFLVLVYIHRCFWCEDKEWREQGWKIKMQEFGKCWVQNRCDHHTHLVSTSSRRFSSHRREEIKTFLVFLGFGFAMLKPTGFASLLEALDTTAEVSCRASMTSFLVSKFCLGIHIPAPSTRIRSKDQMGSSTTKQ